MSPAQAQQAVQDITSQLISKYQAEKVILFGSAVTQPDLANDLDFLIIKKDVPPSGLDRVRQVRGLIKKTVAADFLILTPQEVEERSNLGDPFVLHIINEGKVLHG